MPYHTIPNHYMLCHTIPHHIISFHTIPLYLVQLIYWVGWFESTLQRLALIPWEKLPGTYCCLKRKKDWQHQPSTIIFFTFKMVMILELAFCRKTCPNLIIYAETLYFLKFNSRDGWKPIRDRKKAKSKESRKTEEKSKAYTGKPIRDEKNIKSKEFWKQKRNLKHLLSCLLSEFEGFRFNW